MSSFPRFYGGGISRYGGPFDTETFYVSAAFRGNATMTVVSSFTIGRTQLFTGNAILGAMAIRTSVVHVDLLGTGYLYVAHSVFRSSRSTALLGNAILSVGQSTRINLRSAALLGNATLVTGTTSIRWERSAYFLGNATLTAAAIPSLGSFEGTFAVFTNPSKTRTEVRDYAHEVAFK